MERKIENFAEEKFNFELPEILVLPSALEVSVRTDTGAVGSFKIRYKDELKYSDRKIRGYVTCNDYRLKFDKVTFSGQEVEIKFEFDGRGLAADQDYSGNIRLITDCGEITVPYFIKVKEEALIASGEDIKNIYQFASFAEHNFELAAKIFYSDEFEKYVLKDKEELKLIRRGLLGNKDRYRALEEFFCFTKSKQRVRLTTDRTVFNFHISGLPIKDKIVIHKSNWGYVKADIITEGKFFRINKNEVTNESFEDGEFTLEVFIDPRYIRSEKASGRIIFRTFEEDLCIEFNFINTTISPEKSAANRKRFEYTKKLIDEFYAYRMGTSSLKNVTTAARTILYGIGISGRNQEIVDYVNIYLHLINGNEAEAKEELAKLNTNTQIPLFRLIYIYFKYRLAPDDHKDKYRREIEKLINIKGYQAGLYFLIHMDGRYKMNLARRLDFIEQLYTESFQSPFLLMEAWSIYKAQPDYFAKLNPFSIQVVNWAIKHGFFSGKLVTEKFVILANELREFSPLVIKLLEVVYKNWGVEEVVQAICAQLIRKKSMDEADHEWYRIGIKRGIKLTGIYELYMRTMRDDSDEKIELSVYSYFLYDNTLNTAKKALLYSYLIKNKNEADLQDIYREYKEQIYSFASEQIKKGEISSNLATVYKLVFKDYNFLSEHYSYLPSVIFKKKIVCKNANMQFVTIVTRGLMAGSSYKFNDGVAIADVSGEYSTSVVADKEGNLYPAKEYCDSERLINYYDYLNSCYEAGDRSYMELLTIVAENDRFHKQCKHLTEICEQLLASKVITEEYKYFIRNKLLEYYFEANEGEKLELILNDYDFNRVDGKLADYAANIALIRNVYPLSLQALKLIGLDMVGAGKLSKVISSYIEDEDEARKKENFGIIISSAYRLLLDKKADEEVIIFLRDNYEGGVTELDLIYKELRDRDLLNVEFVSRVIQQMLFSESLAVESDKIFEYYEKFGEETLSKAFLSYVSYKWLVRDVRVGKYFEKRIYDEAYKTKSTLFIVSYLKILSEKKFLTDEERDYVTVWVENLAEDGIILPFFKEFKNKCRLPAEIENSNYVVCYADSEDEVAINYRIISSANGGDRSYTVEWMKNVYQGIFVKEFLVFADEVVQYYISIKEKGDDEPKIIMSDELVIKQDVLFEEDLGHSLFSQINMMYVCKDLSDEKTLKEYMRNYVAQKEIIDKLFSLETIDEEF